MATIRLGVVGGTGRLHQSPSLVAFGQDHFARQGLDIEVSDYSGGDAGVKLLGADELDVAALGPGLFLGHRFWIERPAEAQRYVVGYLQGLRSYYDAFEHNHNKDAAIDALARESDYARDAIANEMVPALVNPDGYLNGEGMAAELQWLENEDVLPRPIPLDRVVNHAYLDAAIAELGPYRPPDMR